jgi:TnpA family transposase
MYVELTDLAIKMFDELWEGLVGKSRRQMQEYQQATARTKDALMLTLSSVVRLVVDEENVPAKSLRQLIFEQVPKDVLREAVETVHNLTELNKHSHLDFLAVRYSVIKQFSPALLSGLAFQNGFEGDDFFQALQLVIELQSGKRKKLTEKVPTDFATPTWQKFFRGDNQAIKRTAYELCVLSTLRDRLRSGDIFLLQSHKYASFDSCLLSKVEWVRDKAEIFQLLALPDMPADRLDDQLAELESYLPRMDQILQEGGDIRLDEAGELIITPLEAEDIPPSATELNERIRGLMPEIELTDLLLEVDGWTGFSQCLEGVENAPKARHHLSLLYASILANRCNIPLTDMARSSGLDYQSLLMVSHHYLREDTLKQANNRLINYHHRQWLPAHWGDGTISSSDGQRFPVSGKVRNAKGIPRYFGYGKGLTFYTHTSDQYSQYGSLAIPTTIRDATFVLDEILGNETELSILEHMTDTAGVTDIIFALFNLLGLQFSPRIRDLANQRLCKIKGRDLEYPSLKFTGSFNPEYVRKHWDELLRVAGSLKMGKVTASLLISKLQAYPRQHNLTYLLQEYGRLVKTNFILRYLQSQPLRRKINAQLNKEELLHALRAWLWFGGDGSIRRKQEQAQQETVRCLNILVNGCKSRSGPNLN